MNHCKDRTRWRNIITSMILIGVALLPLVSGYLPPTNNPGWEKLSKYNTRVGAAFMKKNHQDPEIRYLPSGIQYKVLVDGDGEYHPTRSCQVKIHHAGKDIRGRVFEDTWSRGQPEELTLGGVLMCWQHAIERMVVGDVWEITTPPHLAYAHYGVPSDKIGPNETLVFKLKLVDFNCPTNDPIAKNWVHPDKSLSESDPSPPSDSKPKIRVNHMHGSRGADTVKADL